MRNTNFYRRIFVIGSGFSKSFCPGLPTLRDLNKLIPDGIGGEFPHFGEYCRRLLRLCHGERSYLDIESLATSILSARIFPSERERLYHSSLRFELLRFIASTIRNDEPVAGNAFDILSRFLETCINCPSEGFRDTLLLTFNYDTLIENVVMNDSRFLDKVSVDYGLRIERADRSAGTTRLGRTIDLLKLHGSLNWFPVKGATDELDLKNVCQVEQGDRSFPIYCEDTPIYIPMAHAKESFLKGSLFNLIWSKADYYLAHAEEIYFLGYGFPKSDVNNLEFLLSHGDRIRAVVVMEDESHPELKRLRQLFGNRIVNCDVKKWLCENMLSLRQQEL